jgi:hypothetical protein
MVNLCHVFSLPEKEMFIRYSRSIDFIFTNRRNEVLNRITSTFRVAIMAMVCITLVLSCASAAGTSAQGSGMSGQALTSGGKPGTLTVQSVPSGASVSLDGSYAGTTPLTIKVSGKHTLTISKNGYKDYRGIVCLIGGTSKASIIARLQKI